jgi:uncharacterized metal-binding protein
MASGKNHDLSISFGSAVILAAGFYYFGSEIGIICASAHLLAGLYLSPDLDLVSRPFKRWGCLRIVWIPYQKLVPRHRHWLSHGIIVGSALRLIYVAALLSPLWFIFPGLQQVKWAGITAANVIAFLVGVEISALNHLLLDGMLIPLPQGIKNKLKG